MRFDPLELEALLDASRQADVASETRFQPMAAYKPHALSVDTVMMAALLVAVACWML